MMKRAIYLIAGILVLSMLSCNRLKQLAAINVPIPYNYDFTVPDYVDTMDIPLGSGLDIALPAIPIETNSQQYLKDYNTSPEKIVGVTLSTLTLRVLQPPGGNFDFISAVSVYLSAPGLPEVQVASKYGIPNGVDSLSLDCTGDDLRNYFLSDTMYVRLNGHFDEAPPPNTTFRIHSVFTLRANPLN
jgi:hypothetical protein